AVSCQRPDELILVAEIPGNPDAEHERVASRKKMRRLPLIRAAGLDVVVGTYGNVELLFPVSIHVAEEKIARPIGCLFPALERRRHALASRVGELCARHRPVEPMADQKDRQSRTPERCKSCSPRRARGTIEHDRYRLAAAAGGRGKLHNGQPMTTSFRLNRSFSRRLAISC